MSIIYYKTRIKQFISLPDQFRRCGCPRSQNSDVSHCVRAGIHGPPDLEILGTGPVRSGFGQWIPVSALTITIFYDINSFI